ncbi:MAG: type II secretion system protein GspN [Syntrophales bacterium]
MKSFIKIICLLSSACLVLAIVVGFVLLSPERLKGYISGLLLEINPNITVSIESVGLRFPPGVKISGMVIGFRDKSNPPIETQMVIARPRLGSLLLGRLSLLLNVDAYGGSAFGSIDFIRCFSMKGPFRTALNFENINIGDSTSLKAFMGRGATGILKGSIDYNGDTTGLPKGSGRAGISIRDGLFQPEIRIPGLATAAFDSLDADMILSNGMLKINRLTLAGKDMRGTLKGHVFLKDELAASELSMNGDLEIPAEPKIRVVLAIAGTIAKPTIQVM